MEFACQGEKISAFLLISALEILFLLIKSKPEITGLTLFNSNCLYSAYVDGATFSLKDIIFIKHMAHIFFPTFSD